MIPASSTDCMPILRISTAILVCGCTMRRTLPPLLRLWPSKVRYLTGRNEEIIEQLILSFAFGQVSLERVRRPVTATRLCSLLW